MRNFLFLLSFSATACPHEMRVTHFTMISDEWRSLIMEILFSDIVMGERLLSFVFLCHVDDVT